ncbi:hypothetical protein CN165_31150 [Sinorhizobium medicae]|uniref:hypothetical protein n=1 Tax=Sinorhizobium medicae TaxID=110321 RepID=UPI000FD70DD2|nr:hypothetical protein [Sinorhizobium medicae]RVK08925.1 hypothetical protein CN165_31150 [Sinorhizobium medicae]
MKLDELLKKHKISKALIVDDVIDQVPKAADIGAGNEAWPTFNDDLTEEQRGIIGAEYPRALTDRFDDLVADNGYVGAIWRLRERLGDVAAPLFEAYMASQTSDDKYVQLVRTKLEAQGITCELAGRSFKEKATDADLIVIDLYFGTAQDDAALAESKLLLKDALLPRAANPPLVILMSRSPRLEGKRDEFRDDVGLIDSAFRIIKKGELEHSDRLEIQLERLAQNAEDSAKLARFFHALDVGIKTAADQTLVLLRKLRLSDIGQIQQLLLSAEGEPTGSYLVDVFDRVLQHEIESHAGIIDAARDLNGFKAINHPPPYVAGSSDLQDLVQRLLTQHKERLRLPGSVEAVVTFGDILRMPLDADEELLKRALLVDLGANDVLLVLTPVCDLQRGGAPRILLLVGKLKMLNVEDWAYGDEARTPSIKIDGALHWIKWSLKHVDTVSWDRLESALGAGDIRIVARLREAHALELQQKVLSGLGRVGLLASLPATFPVDVEVFFPDAAGVPTALAVPELADGAVCFVGRDEKGNQAIRLVMTEGSCDGVERALNALDVGQVASKAHTALDHLRTSTDLRRLMAAGLDLKGVSASDWALIASETGADKGVPKMGLIAWNLPVTAEPLKKNVLNKAGIIIVIKDAAGSTVPGLGKVINTGALQPADNLQAEGGEADA